MPISIVSDLDVRSIEYYNEQKDAKKFTIYQKILRKSYLKIIMMM